MKWKMLTTVSRVGLLSRSCQGQPVISRTYAGMACQNSDPTTLITPTVPQRHNTMEAPEPLAIIIKTYNIDDTPDKIIDVHIAQRLPK